jgi:hypothetical protein
MALVQSGFAAVALSNWHGRANELDAVTSADPYLRSTLLLYRQACPARPLPWPAAGGHGQQCIQCTVCGQMCLHPLSVDLANGSIRLT